MNWQKIMSALKPMPVLLVVPTRDLPNLLAMKSRVFADLPPHPMNRLYEPDSNHIGAVNASATEVVSWIGLVVAQAAGFNRENAKRWPAGRQARPAHRKATIRRGSLLPRRP